MINLSIIVPCYNEVIRAKDFLDNLLSFCKYNIGNYEVILIDDGSVDETYGLLISFSKKYRNVVVLRNRFNLGKGASVRKGVLNSKGNYVIFIDADGSTSEDQIPILLDCLKSNDVVIGDRYSKRSEVIQPFSRYILGSLFNMYVNQIFKIKIYDCLCGFKGFKRRVAIDLFSDLIEQRWLFDVEILYKAKIKKHPIKKYQLGRDINLELKLNY